MKERLSIYIWNWKEPKVLSVHELEKRLGLLLCVKKTKVWEKKKNNKHNQKRAIQRVSSKKGVRVRVDKVKKKFVEVGGIL